MPSSRLSAIVMANRAGQSSFLLLRSIYIFRHCLVSLILKEEAFNLDTTARMSVDSLDTPFGPQPGMLGSQITVEYPAAGLMYEYSIRLQWVDRVVGGLYSDQAVLDASKRV